MGRFKQFLLENTSEVDVRRYAIDKGYDLTLYHGTWGGNFYKFKEGSHFSADKKYASRYENPSASSLGKSGKVESVNPRTLKLYVKMNNPFDTRIDRIKNIFLNEFYMKWGTGTPLQESGLPDWIDGLDLDEFIKEEYPEFDGIILDEGGEPNDKGGVNKRPNSYIIKNPNQIKSADPVTYDDQGNIIPLSKRFDQSSDDIRY